MARFRKYVSSEFFFKACSRLGFPYYIPFKEQVCSIDISKFEPTQKKRECLYLLPSYFLRLLALPYYGRMATQKPTLVYATIASGL